MTEVSPDPRHDPNMPAPGVADLAVLAAADTFVRAAGPAALAAADEFARPA